MVHLVVHGDLNEALVSFPEQPLVEVQVLVHVKVDLVVERERIKIIQAEVLVEDIQVVQPLIMAPIMKAAAAVHSTVERIK
jgi:hypothetical protein